MESKALAIGSADFVMPFAALGLDTLTVEADADEVLDAAGKIPGGHYAMVIVAENIAGYAREVFDSIAEKATPCVIVVPFMKETSGIATEALGRALKLATGINILG